MNFKKTIAKSLVVAMALGMVPVANLQTAKADAAAITFDGATGIAKSETAKFWGIAKEAKKEGKDTVKLNGKDYKITNIQEVVEKEIDAYAALKGKAGIIVAGVKERPDTNWGVLNLPAAESTFKVYMVASKGAIKGIKGENAVGGEYGYLAASVGKQPKEVSLVASKDAIEVKINDGNWTVFSTALGSAEEAINKKLHMLGQNGSTLSFRIKGTTTAWASKEAKVKALSPAKGPSVKIDVAKDTTSIKTGMEYQVVKSGEALGSTWNVSTEKKGLSLADLKLGTTEAKDVAVRTAATAKKLASKVTKVTVNKPGDALTIDGGKFESTGAAIKKGNDVVAVLESNLAYNITKGANLTNVSSLDIEYALVKEGTTADKVKWSTVKASKDPVKKPTKASLKYSATTKDNTWGDGKAKLFVRLAGTKQTKENIATQSGVSVGAVVALKNIEQTFKFTAAEGTEATANIEGSSATTASIKVATGTAAVVKLKGLVSKVVSPKGGSLKIKAKTALPKGVTIKAGKVDVATGVVEVTVNISKAAFKTEVPDSTSEYTVQFEGINDGFKIKLGKKS